ncbi:uncharacterized protein TNCV_5066931 [Trichonephila clavipes]|nr:uncharacterized protein TNCV_5066931 [Trichonephila clavipes]
MAYSDFEKAEAFKDTLEVTFQENEEPYCDDKIEKVENLVNHFFDNFATKTPPLTSPSEDLASLGSRRDLSFHRTCTTLTRMTSHNTPPSVACLRMIPQFSRKVSS